MKFKTYRLEYLDPNNEEQEVDIGIEESDFITMFNKLVSKFGAYCAEIYDDDPCWILQIKEADDEDFDDDDDEDFEDDDE